MNAFSRVASQTPPLGTQYFDAADPIMYDASVWGEDEGLLSAGNGPHLSTRLRGNFTRCGFSSCDVLRCYNNDCGRKSDLTLVYMNWQQCN